MSRRAPLFFLSVVLLSLFSRSAAGEPVLVDGDRAVHLRRHDHGPLMLLATEDPRIQLREVAGSEALVRLTPLDDGASVIDGGSLVLLKGSEARTVRLRDRFGGDLSKAVDLRMEVLEGSGRVEIVSSSGLESSVNAATDATATRRRGVKFGVQGLDLIDADEASGKLSSETALLYRVYSLFHDARLPAPYQGGKRPEDSLYMSEVKNRFRTLSPEMQAILQPFLTPPAYAGSWVHAGFAKTPGANANRCDLFGAWRRFDAVNSPYTVWFDGNNAQDETRAEQIITAIDDVIYRNIADLMSPHRPLSDALEECNGGDGRLDIFVSDIDLNLIVPEGGAEGATVPYEGCKNTPAYIVLARNAKDSSVAHEIFHGFQFSYDLQGCLGGEDYGWWAEASATWATDFVYKAANGEHGFAQWFLDRPEVQLDLKDGKHEYGAYLLPFFVHRKTGTPFFVSAAWKLCEIEPALEAVNDAIPGGFKDIWPEFVRAAWNRPPDNQFDQWDMLDWGARPFRGVPVDVALGSLPDARVDLQVDLPLLSATYKHFKFTDDSVKTVAFWNGVTSKLEETPGVFTTYYLSGPSSDHREGDRVQAFIKIRGQDWRVEKNWTDRPLVTFCRDVASERLEELVIIISNSEFMERGRRLQPSGLEPVLWASNMGCYKWEGTSTFDGLGTPKIECQTNLTLTRVDDAANTLGVAYDATASGTWKVSGSCSGMGALSFPSQRGMTTFNLVTRGLAHRGYAGGVTPNLVTVNCSGQMIPLPLLNCFLVPGPGVATVDRTGTILDRTSTVPGSGTLSYRLTSRPQQ